METFVSWLLTSSEDFQFYFFFGFLFSLMVVEQFFHFREIVRKDRWVANFITTVIAIMVMMVLPVTFISSAAYAYEKHWGFFNWVKVNWLAAGLLTLFFRDSFPSLLIFLHTKSPSFGLRTAFITWTRSLTFQPR